MSEKRSAMRKRSTAAALSVLLVLGQAGAVWAEDADAPFPITSSSTTTIQEDGTVITTDDTPAVSFDGEPYAGTLGDHGLTPEEFTAEHYLRTPADPLLQDLKNISAWPSENMLRVIEDTNIPVASGVWKAAHSLTNPSEAVDNKLEAYYEAMLVSLLVDSSELIDWSDVTDHTDQLKEDNDTLQSILGILGEDKKISTLSEQEKEELENAMNEAIPELPTTLYDKVWTLAGSVKDLIDRIDEYNALSKIGGEARTVLIEMENHTDDEDLRAAIDAVIIAMDSSSDGFWEALIMSGAELTKKEIYKAVDSAFSELVMSLPPLSDYFVGLKIGTMAADLFTSSFFDTEGTIAAYIQLECLGKMARALNETQDTFGQRYQAERGGSDTMQRRVNAQAFNWSVRALTDLHLLSFDYVKDWADQSTDTTWYEKWKSMITNGNFGEYAEFYQKLAYLKREAVTRKYNLIMQPVIGLQDRFPDDYNIRTVNGMSMDEYLNALYNESADKAKEAYDGILSKSGGTAWEYSGSSDAAQSNTSPQKTADDLFDAFCANEISGTYGGWTFYLRDLQDTSQYPVPYEVGPRIDVDNDGENELLLLGSDYGGMFLDAKDGTVKAFASGNGTAEYLSYGYYDGSWLVCHQDTSHQGSKFYWFDQYSGADTIVQSFELSADYGDGPDANHYNENSAFLFKNQPITMEEYEGLLTEIFAKSDPSYGKSGLARADGAASTEEAGMAEGSGQAIDSAAADGNGSFGSCDEHVSYTDAEVAIDPQVIYDDHDLKVTITGYSPYDGKYSLIYYTVQNTGSVDYDVEFENLSVNNCGLPSDILGATYITAEAGKTVSDSFLIYYDLCGAFGFQKLEKFSLEMSITQSSEGALPDFIELNRILEFKTNQYDGAEYFWNLQLQSVAQGEGWKLWGKIVKADEVPGMPRGIYLFLENHTGEDLHVYGQHFSYNGGVTPDNLADQDFTMIQANAPAGGWGFDRYDAEGYNDGLSLQSVDFDVNFSGILPLDQRIYCSITYDGQDTVTDEGGSASDDVIYYGSLTSQPFTVGWPYVTGVSMDPENRTITVTGELATVSLPVPEGYDLYDNPQLTGTDSLTFPYDDNTIAGGSSGEDKSSSLSAEEFVQYMQECLGNGLGFEMEVKDGVIVNLMLLS